MFTTFIIQPIYNLFVAILGIMPGGDSGLAIIALTVLVRVVFYPLFTSSIRSQMAMQAVQPEIAKIKERYKDDSTAQARETAAVFVKHNIKPFSLIFSTILQITIFIALSYVFFRLSPPTIHSDLLYSFVHAPSVISAYFLGFIDVSALHSIILTILVAITQYYAIRLSLDRTQQKLSTDATPEQIASQKMQKIMMVWMLPIMSAVFTYTFPAAVGIYMVITSIVSIIQEIVIKRNPL